MANSDYFTITQTAAREVGVLSTFTRVDFVDNTRLIAPVLKLKLFVNKCNKMLLRKLSKNFTRRRFVFNTVAGQAVYALDSSTNPESIVLHTMRCNTTGAAIPMGNYSYQEFRDLYPDLTLVPQSKPLMWVQEFGDLADGLTRTNEIRIVPTPDATYEIEFIAKLTAADLVADTDSVVWPQECEDVLITWAGAMLESKLGVDATQERYAQMAIDDIRMFYERAQDERRGVRIGLRLNDGTSGDNPYYDYPSLNRGW